METVDHSKMKLGKREPGHDPRTLKLADYVSALPAPPASVHYDRNIPATGWGMMGNDKIGDCTCAGIGHAIMAWTADCGTPVQVSDQDVIDLYSAVTGYDPATGANDNGAQLIDILRYVFKNGIGGHKIGAYVLVNLKNETEVKQAIELFGLLYIGLALPVSAQTQKTWEVEKGANGEPGSWGGHCVIVPGYNSKDAGLITWGAYKQMTWGFWEKYGDEAYAIISPDFFKNGVAPNGFDVAQLEADLKEVTA